MMRWLKISALCVVCYVGYQQFSNRGVDHPEGIMAVKEDPDQFSSSEDEFKHKQFLIKPLENFNITARVLGAKHYTLDAEASISPVDLALGWGPMSDTAVINQLNISQSGRFYFYRYDLPAPIPPNDIVIHSANMHMIPSDSAIEKKLKDVRVGQIVHITGQLVEVKDTQKNWTWRSSLTRSDSGGGACELIWVKTLSVTNL